MLVIKNEVENWREIALAMIDADVQEVIRESFFDELAEELRDDTLRNYLESGFDYTVTHRQQSAGSFVIVQSGAESEKDAFEAALAKAIRAIQPQLSERVQQETNQGK